MTELELLDLYILLLNNFYLIYQVYDADIILKNSKLSYFSVLIS